jgi:hypothetical protein
MLLLGLGIGIGLLGVCRDIDPFDEAIFLCGAERVLHGELPYRDFYALYPPGQYYAVAALFAGFGHSVLIQRLYCIMVSGLIALLLYLTAQKMAGRTLALVCWEISIVWLTSLGFYGVPVFPALLLTLSSLLILASCADRAQPDERPSRMRLFLSGTVLGAAALFRHDIAFYALLASVPFLAAMIWSAPASIAAPTRPPFARALSLWPYMTGVALMFGIPALWLLARVPIQEVVFELFTYPATSYALMRGTPYPPLSFVQVSFYSPLLFYAIGLVRIVIRTLRQRSEVIRDIQFLRFVSLTLFGTLAFNLARVRADHIHALSMLLPSYIVAAVLIRKASNWMRPWGLLAATSIIVICLLSHLLPLCHFPGPSFGCLQDVMERGPFPRIGAERKMLAEVLRLKVPPGERIFVGCGRHDKIFINEPIIYFMADRLPGTKYHFLDPGVATTLPVQREIVEGLIHFHVSYVVLSSQFDEVDQPNLSAVSSGVNYLDDYLRSHYAVYRKIGEHIVIWRRSEGWER